MEIQVKNLTKEYGPQKAVDDISFQVKTGEILGFLGPNGAGKTTTMKIITNYISANAGDVLLDNTSMLTYGNELKKYIGYLPENTPLYMDMPVLDYLRFSALLQGVSKEKLDQRVRQMVRLTGLDKEKHKKINQLSKGYRQRTGLAQALIHDPEILILDEPTTGLDPNQIVEIRELIKRLGQEKTVILSTHILPEVEATSDRILIINDGKIVADGTAASLRQQAQGSELVNVRIEDGDSNEVYQKLQELPGVWQVETDKLQENRFSVQSEQGKSALRDIFTLAVNNKWVITEMTPNETRLEDVFRNLTTQ